MFEDPLFGIVWTIQYIFVSLLFVGMAAFVIYYWNVSRRRDKENEMRGEEKRFQHK